MEEKIEFYILIGFVIIGMIQFFYLYEHTQKPKNIFYRKIYNYIVWLNLFWILIFIISVAIFKSEIIKPNFKIGILGFTLFPLFNFLVFEGFAYHFKFNLKRKPNLLSKGDAYYTGWGDDFLFTMGTTFIPGILCLIVSFIIN